jgi:putative intracellular protease/amidase
MKILMVLTSHDVLGNTGRKTGFWLEEFAAPYFVFRDASVQLTLASPKGGQPPVDPKSDLPESQTPAMTRFKQDQTAQKGGKAAVSGRHNHRPVGLELRSV